LWKDWYKRELKIDMNEYERRDKWWDKGQNLYLDNYTREGMREISLSEIDYGDIILMHLRSKVPNHAAIYIGNSLILHHVQGRLSSRDIYGGYYQKNTAKILRHESR
jgi:cell wall-associated NlpC family hydrolase